MDPKDKFHQSLKVRCLAIKTTSKGWGANSQSKDSTSVNDSTSATAYIRGLKYFLFKSTEGLLLVWELNRGSLYSHLTLGNVSPLREKGLSFRVLCVISTNWDGSDSAAPGVSQLPGLVSAFCCSVSASSSVSGFSTAPSYAHLVAAPQISSQ